MKSKPRRSHVSSFTTVFNWLGYVLMMFIHHPRASAHHRKEPTMAPVSKAPCAHALTGSPWVRGIAALFLVAVLAGCGGGGGSSTPDGPTVGPLTVTLTLVSAEVRVVNGANTVVYTALGTKGADSGNVDITATTAWVPTLTGQALKAGATLSVAASGRLQENVSGVATDLVVTPGVTITVGGTATYGGKTITVTPAVLTGTCEVGLVTVGGKCVSRAFTEVVVYSTANSMTQVKFGHGPTATYFVFDGVNGRPGNIRTCAISDKVGKKIGGAVLTCSALGTSVFVSYEITPDGYIQKVTSADEPSAPSFDMSHVSSLWTPCLAFGEHWYFIPRTTSCTDANLVRYADGTVEAVDGFRAAIGF